MSLLQAPELSVYVHMPWCVRKCPYCDFNSHAIEGAVPEQRYVAALIRDLEIQADSVRDRQVQSIFFGGGTPSLFSPSAIGRVIDAIRSALRIDAHAEVTLEANPGTIERGRFAEYRVAGVNRVSLGGQSFNERHLATLGRIHSAAETAVAANELHAAGIDNFNIDLMYGLPGQSVAEALEDVRAALALEPQHLSHYQLTLEPGTAFFHRPPALPHDDETWQMQLLCQKLIAQSGFDQYEISAYACNGHVCRHNLNYWRFGDYVGIGAGAHGKVTDARGEVIMRTARTRQPRRYLEGLERGAGLVECHPIAPIDRPFEFMLNALRLLLGFEVEQFERRTGLPLESIESELQEALGRGLLETSASGQAYLPSALGLRFLNDLQGMFLREATSSAHSRHTVQVANPL